MKVRAISRPNLYSVNYPGREIETQGLVDFDLSATLR